MSKLPTLTILRKISIMGLPRYLRNVGGPRVRGMGSGREPLKFSLVRGQFQQPSPFRFSDSLICLPLIRQINIKPVFPPRFIYRSPSSLLTILTILNIYNIPIDFSSLFPYVQSIYLCCNYGNCQRIRELVFTSISILKSKIGKNFH